MVCCASAHGGERYELGRAATAEEIRAWDIDVRADGAGLPAGHGSVAEGLRVYAEKCAVCHGDHGQGGPMDKLAGEQAVSPRPVRSRPWEASGHMRARYSIMCAGPCRSTHRNP